MKSHFWKCILQIYLYMYKRTRRPIVHCSVVCDVKEHFECLSTRTLYVVLINALYVLIGSDLQDIFLYERSKLQNMYSICCLLYMKYRKMR